MRAKGFAAFALLAVIGLGACSSAGTPKAAPTLSLRTPIDGGGPLSLENAKAGFQKTVKNDPNDKYAWYNLGVIAESEKDPTTAAADYEKAIAIKPDFEPALYNLGLIRMHARDYPMAARLLSRAVGADSKDANAHFDLGLALANLHTAAADARSKAELAAARKIYPGLFKGRLYGTGGPTSTTRGR
jgi:tetratricopeptide (TPR) repeat protein